MLNIYMFILLVAMVFGLIMGLGGKYREEKYAGIWLFGIASVLLLIVQILL